MFGVAVSLGLGSSQIAAGLSELFGWDASTFLKIMILAVLTMVCRLDRGGARQRG
ncbi:BCCT family transporter [Sulfitobacter sp. 15WGC]|uniref:BCCT family transporter n=1 Tax=Sulfitobacter sp. 15WGC TaxID=2575437 RepID=UPI0024A7CC7D|nr:BCCT family transporter [Sulfitobacter sp. 15WGC]